MSADNQFDKELPAELKAVESALRRLTPHAEPLDRDWLMYLSGRASVASRQTALRFAWPISTAALLLVSLTLGGVLLNSSHDRPPGQIDNGYLAANSVAVDSNSGDGRSVALAVADQHSSSYLQLRNAVLLGGVDALPSPRNDGHFSNSLEAIPSTPLKFKYFGG